MIRFRWRVVFAVAVTAPLLTVGFVVWRASHAQQEAAAAVHAQADLPFRVVPVDRAIPAGVDVLPASPGFQDLAVYKDTIAVSARAGLFVYNREGGLVHTYRAGLELPAAELGGLSVGAELFIATHGEGLLEFNGSRFRQILPGDSLLRNITCVLALRTGRVLLGTERSGVLVFDGRHLAPLAAGLKSEHITALAGTEGDLFIGTLAAGAFHYRGGEMEQILSALPDPQVLSLSVAEGIAYVGTPLGVVEFVDGKRARTLADGFFARAIAREGDVLHVGTEDEGVVDVPLQLRPNKRIPAGAEDPAVPVVRMANVAGNLYTVTESAVYRDGQAVVSPGRVLLADRNIASLALSGGRLWVGYFDRGVDVVDANQERATHFENDTLFCVNRIMPDAAHSRTAVATANGLVLFDAGAQPRQVLGRKDGLLSDHITDVAFRKDGMVVATPAGLSFVDRSGVRSLYVFQGLVNNHVYTVATRGAETVAGTLGGLSVLEDDAVRANYTTANSHLRHNWITAVVRVGEEWFAGTYGAGVLRLDASGEWHSFSDLNSGFVVNPNAMVVSGGQVYAGSLDRGLFIFDRASARWTNSTMGLPSKNVTALAAGDGYLYIGTDNGLVRMPQGALQ
jgi:ligand-binding sensor domain-containing protein